MLTCLRLVSRLDKELETPFEPETNHSLAIVLVHRLKFVQEKYHQTSPVPSGIPWPVVRGQEAEAMRLLLWTAMLESLSLGH